MSENFNEKGYHPPMVVEDGQCVNCNLCEMICPDFAIFSVADGDAADQTGVEAVDGSRKTQQQNPRRPGKRRDVEN